MKYLHMELLFYNIIKWDTSNKNTRHSYCELENSRHLANAYRLLALRYVKVDKNIIFI